MSSFTLIIGNKNYSSWSLRPWLALKQTGQAFSEIRISLYTPTSRQELLRYSPSGLVPVLQHGELVIWDSLAICEYLAELFPEAQLWPTDPTARAVARSASHEMHSGFRPLRENMPMNCRAHKPGKGRGPGVQENIDRITQLWQICRQTYGAGGDFLFGNFSIADAMYAPVMFRFRTYGVDLDPVCAAYTQSLWEHPFIQDWLAAAQQETEVIAAVEV
jgi:glutathione S-transferase